jgi:membrane associated rhomboid family serine protease
MITALFPIGDDNSDRHIRPVVTYALIALNILVFIFLQLPSDAFTYGFAVIPAEILSGNDYVNGIQVGNGVLPQASGPSPIQLTVFSAMFMHGGWGHLLGNMLYLWIFGDNVEDAMGHVRFLFFYLLCGVIATAAHILGASISGGYELLIPSLGASGAIAGVLGGYLVLYPRKSVVVLIGFFPIPVPAILVIGLWIITQTFSGFASQFATQQTGAGGVAYWAHVGGAVAGLLLVNVFRDPRIRQRALERAHMTRQGSFYRR